MLIEKYTSIKPVIERVYVDTDLQADIAFEDYIMWAVECMELIGYPLQYVPKVLGKEGEPLYEFDNFRIPLPCDFHKLEAVAVNGLIAYHATDSFHYLLDGGCCGYDNVSSDIEDLFITNIAQYSPQAEPIVSQFTDQPIITFDINDSFITFNKQEGEACIAYKAFPVDDNGFPLIPDNAKYKRAVTDYLRYKVDYRLWRGGYIPEAIYREAEKQWNWSIASATSALKMSSVHEWESIKQAFHRMIPLTKEYGRRFRNMLNKNTRV